MTPDQLARATDALNTWYADSAADLQRPTWEPAELRAMHAALEASTVDAALEALGITSDSWLSEPGQDARNRASMIELRKALLSE